MPLVAFPGSRFARSLRFPFRSLIWGVRGWRPVGVLGILTKPRFELFYALGQFLDQLVLLQDQSPDSGRRLFPVLFADGQSLGKILQRYPGTLRLVSLLASCPNLSVSSTRTFSACPVKNVCGLHKSSPPLNAYVTTKLPFVSASKAYGPAYVWGSAMVKLSATVLSFVSRTRPVNSGFFPETSSCQTTA